MAPCTIRSIRRSLVCGLLALVFGRTTTSAWADVHCTTADLGTLPGHPVIVANLIKSQKQVGEIWCSSRGADSAREVSSPSRQLGLV